LLWVTVGLEVQPSTQSKTHFVRTDMQTFVGYRITASSDTICTTQESEGADHQDPRISPLSKSRNTLPPLNSDSHAKMEEMRAVHAKLIAAKGLTEKRDPGSH
jgi:hypothetical protein